MVPVKDRHVEHNKKGALEIESQKYSQLIFDKAVKPIQWRKDSISNKCGCCGPYSKNEPQYISGLKQNLSQNDS